MHGWEIAQNGIEDRRIRNFVFFVAKGIAG